MIKQIAKAPIHFYRLVISPWLGSNCRFHPTCSAYALEAIDTHGPLKGLWLGFKRILRCTPWNTKAGVDPVPQKRL